MKIIKKEMGPYQTNCYIVSIDGKDLIIDPGVDATQWVLEQVTNPIAILNTHGHFDHVWSNAALQDALNIPLYSPKEDAFLLQNSTFVEDLPPSTPDYYVEGNETVDIEGITVSFQHYPGHCPGCSMIQIGDQIFSGDFIFNRSIGRYDFPYSDAKKMCDSLERFAKRDDDATLHPGHGDSTSIKQEQRFTQYWINTIKAEA